MAASPHRAPAARLSPAPRRRSIFTARLTRSTGSGEKPRVLADLRAAIIAGAEPPGTAIPIDEVARFFGVSPIPVREALKILLGEGLVEHVPNVGYSVATLTSEELAELYEVRHALETVALRAAVARSGPEDRAAAERAHRETTAAMKTHHDAAFHRASRDFHVALLRPSGMVRLLSMHELAWNMTEAFRPMSRVAATLRADLCRDHGEILATYSARDVAGTLRASARHHARLVTALGTYDARLSRIGAVTDISER